MSDLPMRVRRLWLSGALNRLILLMMLPAVLVIALFPPGEVFPHSELLESMYLVGWLTGLVLEVRSALWPLAVIDDGGITYADGWGTYRVSFGDVAAWHRDPTRGTFQFTTRDGSEWLVSLRTAAYEDKKQALALVTDRLRGVPRREARRFAPGLGRQLLVASVQYVVLILASMQLIHAWNTWEDGWPHRTSSIPTATAPVQTREHVSQRAPIEGPYGPLFAGYSAPQAAETTLPLWVGGDNVGPWESPNCTLYALVGSCRVRL